MSQTPSLPKDKAFHLAMNAGKYAYLSWCISAFSMVLDKIDVSKLSEFDIFQDSSGHYMLINGELTRLDGCDPKIPPYTPKEMLLVTKQDIPNLKVDKDATTYGNLIANWIVLVNPFGSRVSYHNAAFLDGRISSELISRLKDDPEDGAKSPDEIYVSDYHKYSTSLDYLREFSQLCVWAVTKKALLPPPGLAELKKKLIDENKGSLSELSKVAWLQEELGKLDDAWLKGDPCENFLLGKKARRVVRMKKFLSLGSDTGFQSNATHGAFIANSLLEGWDVSKFPEMNNSSRAGSYNRGAQTALGGVSVKWLLRSTSNLKITKEDCGSKAGILVHVDKTELDYLPGMTVISETGALMKVSDRKDAEKYLGTALKVRSPMYCNLTYTDYCKTCVGERLSISQYGLPVTCSDYGSAFMGMFMAAMHGKQLATTKWSLLDTLS